MRILVVVHQFLPRHRAGTEVYTHKIARALRERGHEVWVYTAAPGSERPEYELARESLDGLPVLEVARKKRFEDFRSTYRDERMEEHLEALLDELRPDLVHVQHLYHHSVGYLERIAARDLPIAYTLAEYLPICLRAWLVKRDFELCRGPEVTECTRCALGWSPFPRGPRESRLAALAERELRGGRRKRSVGRFLRKVGHRLWPGEMRAAVGARLEEHAAAFEHVDLFLAPSRFLLERYVEAGFVAPDRIVHSDYGTDLEPFRDVTPRERTDGALRVGFVGAVAEQKGVELLARACSAIDDPRLECRIHGDLGAWPDYAARVRAASDPARVRLLPGFPNERVAEVLGELDVLAVPSLWYENSPLTIHEAFAAGLPVITGDDGGMAELVEHDVSGLHFRIGDARDLERQLRRLLDEPDLLPRLRAGVPPLKTLAEDAEDLEARFEELVRRRRSGAPGAP